MKNENNDGEYKPFHQVDPISEDCKVTLLEFDNKEQFHKKLGILATEVNMLRKIIFEVVPNEDFTEGFNQLKIIYKSLGKSTEEILETFDKY